MWIFKNLNCDKLWKQAAGKEIQPKKKYADKIRTHRSHNRMMAEAIPYAPLNEISFLLVLRKN